MGDMMASRFLMAVAVAIAAPIATPAALAHDVVTPASAPTRHITQTYLRAAPGKRAALIAYIDRNWFAMDRVGIDQGLFTRYALMQRADDTDADWDIIVTVGYPTARGHDAPGVAEAFNMIRAAHREIKVDGLGLKELGTIVRHYPLTLELQGQ